MELVYLWVEDYKNIKNQGFNFSARFRCNYNKEKNELTIKENDDYIENFFGENINVTAIVGKNGSGKSNLLDILLEDKIRDFSDIKGNRIRVYLQDNELLLRFDNSKNSKIFIENIDFKKEIVFDIKSDTNQVKKPFSSFKFKTVFYKNILDNRSPSGDTKLYINLSSDHLLKNGNDIYYSINTKKIIKLLKKKKINFPFKTPSKLILKRNYKYFNHIKNLLRPPRYNNYRDKFKKILKEDISLKLSLWLIYHINNDEYSDKFPETKNIKSLINQENFIEYLENLHQSDKDKIDNFYEILQEKFSNEQFNKYESRIKNIPDDFIDKYNQIDKNNELFIFEYGEEDLSSGQYYLLLFFAHIFDVIQSEPETKKFIIYIDEGDLTLHPQWQKKFLSDILYFFNENFKEIKFHLILTTHSPFLISDLSKENIIFLKNGKEDKGVNHKQTFGANIHTLLSDSFFMEDGLMGEFAKEKIENVIKFLKDEESIIKNKEEAKKIIDIIGESFIRDKLLYMYKEKFPVSKEDKIKELEEELRRLKGD